MPTRPCTHVVSHLTIGFVSNFDMIICNKMFLLGKLVAAILVSRHAAQAWVAYVLLLDAY